MVASAKMTPLLQSLSILKKNCPNVTAMKVECTLNLDTLKILEGIFRGQKLIKTLKLNVYDRLPNQYYTFMFLKSLRDKINLINLSVSVDLSFQTTNLKFKKLKYWINWINSLSSLENLNLSYTGWLSQERNKSKLANYIAKSLNNRRLKALNLSIFRVLIDKFDSNLMARYLRNLVELTSLTLKINNCDIEQKYYQNLLEVIPNLINLTKLEISISGTILDDFFLENLIEKTQNMTNFLELHIELKHTILNETVNDNELITKRMQIEKEFSNINSFYLTLEESIFPPNMIKTISAMLKRMKNLKSLTLNLASHTQQTNFRFDILFSEGIFLLEQLVYLDIVLWSIIVDDTTLILLNKLFCINFKLKRLTLYFAYATLSSEGIVIFAEGLSKCKDLESLTLNICKPFDFELDLDECEQIITAGLNAIGQALLRLKNLKKLKIVMCDRVYSNEKDTINNFIKFINSCDNIKYVYVNFFGYNQLKSLC